MGSALRFQNCRILMSSKTKSSWLALRPPLADTAVRLSPFPTQCGHLHVAYECPLALVITDGLPNSVILTAS